MPEICRFLGVVVTINFSDHNPPHFHVRYNKHKCIIEMNTLSLIEGSLPPRVFGLVIEWASLHRQELIENWNLAVKQMPIRKIAPLE